MSKALRYPLQALLYGAFITVLGYFSTSPSYRHLPPEQALVKLSFTHAAQRKQECRTRTPEELAKLPPNMRIAEDCPRERSSITVELEMDGKPLYHLVAEPTGFAKDGAATVYRRLPVAAGSHHFKARLRDKEPGDFNYTDELTVDLAPGRIMVIDFDPNRGGFVFRT